MTRAIEILPASAQDRPILSNLVELYVYDFSEFMGWDVGDDGRFGDDDLAGWWSEPWRHPFVIKVGGKMAGFAIVDERSYLTGAPEVRAMKEFFILRKYRRLGVGAYVATCLFDRLPGKWEVRQLANNVAALEFWRSVIGSYTGNQFEESEWAADRHHGQVQHFTTANRVDILLRERVLYKTSAVPRQSEVADRV